MVTLHRLQRLGLIAIVGYLLHVSWDHCMKGDFFAELLYADVLQCLAASLVIPPHSQAPKRVRGGSSAQGAEPNSKP